MIEFKFIEKGFLGITKANTIRAKNMIIIQKFIEVRTEH